MSSHDSIGIEELLVQLEGRKFMGIKLKQSALTDFLAAHNINANQIREEANARRAAAIAAEAAQNALNADEPSSSSAVANNITIGRRDETKEEEIKRKKKESTAIASIKASRSSKRRRKTKISDNELSDKDNDSLDFINFMDPLPQPMSNCGICNIRFLATVYSQFCPGSQGKGVLCPNCSSSIGRNERAEKKQKVQKLGTARRKNASNLLDGVFLHCGSKKLVSLCVETLANHVHQAESFGSLPVDLVQRLGAILSKRRLITSPILDLFLEQKHDSLIITDGAKLNTDDYCRIFQLVPSIKYLKLRNAIQFKNQVVDFLLGTTVNLVSLDLHGANLIDDERWESFITQKAAHLRTLKVHFTDSYFGDRVVELLPICCPNLQRLKISHNSKVSDSGLEPIALLSSLDHLSLELYRPMGKQPLSSIPMIKILDSIGSRLRTFSIESVIHIEDSLLDAIHKNCRELKKLRITDSERLTDEGFALLFKDWSNPPLFFIDLSGCRHVDAVFPRNNLPKIGLFSLGFEALMSHSGSLIKNLNISSCRHISAECFESVFTAEKQYPDLEQMDISFCQAVNDFIVGCIFRSCPKLRILIVFGCFGVKDVKVPKGRMLIGTPNAVGMKIEGTEE
ncbi:DNA repair protein rhp7 [Erysiphe neolycopersici]|uniref:DNA repair protein rhp7 n=1 Tax=Erysiphe neolycopersici TaxID=212602 RepID=A0A420HRD5_9PEZI|nr:DNA repair protein rhp7 [Erysiphe neolycopersici]